MNSANLPTETANEPLEDARQFQVEDQVERRVISTKPNNSVNNYTEALNGKQKNRAYKEILSQPPQELSHKQKLIWLQKRRSTGLWVQCDDCDRWRYLDNILDSFELPKKWYCRMNPDSKFANCSVPEAPLQVREEEDLIHSKYSAGSVVWARLPGWPWWPAMIDDCPDTEQFYWLDGFSDIPTHYNVVFFDVDVTRAWMSTEQLKPYINKKDVTFKTSLTDRKYTNRFKTATVQANDAIALPLCARLAKYSFIARYKGNISTPKKVDRFYLQKYQNKMKRKFNIDFPIESSSDSDDNEIVTIIRRAKTSKETKTNKIRIEPELSNRDIVNNEAKIQKKSIENDSQKENISSMAVQVSNNNSIETVSPSVDNINATFTLETNAQVSGTEVNDSFQKRNSTPNFEFE